MCFSYLPRSLPSPQTPLTFAFATDRLDRFVLGLILRTGIKSTQVCVFVNIYIV